jgi:hypothetical protein
LVYDVQKALARRAKSPIQVPDWTATIVFPLAFAIGMSIHKAKGGNGIERFLPASIVAMHLAPLLMNNPEPAILRRSVGRNFQIIGARLTCMILPSAGKDANWRRFSKRRPIQERANAVGSLNLSGYGRPRAIGLARAKIRPLTSDGVLGPRICSTACRLRPQA